VLKSNRLVDYSSRCVESCIAQEARISYIAGMIHPYFRFGAFWVVAITFGFRVSKLFQVVDRLWNF